MSEPVAKALLMCKYATGLKAAQWSLIDIFNTTRLHSFPGSVGAFNIYVHACDVPATPVLSFQVENQSGMVLWTSGPIDYKMPEGVTDIQFVCGVPGFKVIGPGKCRVAFFIGSDRIGDTQLEVAQSEVVNQK